MKKNIRKCILLVSACALMGATPLSLAMHLQEKRLQTIDDLRSAYFYLKSSYSKNKDKKIRCDNIKNLATYLIHENETHNYENILLQEILPNRIPDNIAQMHINYLHLIEISKYNNEYSEPIIYCVKTLHDYYEFLCNKKNIPCDPESIIKQNDIDLTFKWPFSKNSSEKKNFLLLLQKQRSNLTSRASIFDYLGIFFGNPPIMIVSPLLPVVASLVLATVTKNNLCCLLFFLSLLLCPLSPFLILVFADICNDFGQYYRHKECLLNRIFDTTKTTSCHISTDEKSMPFKAYFDNLYWKAKKFIKNNKNQEFIKNFKHRNNRYIFLRTLILQEEDLLFNCE